MLVQLSLQSSLSNRHAHSPPTLMYKPLPLSQMVTGKGNSYSNLCRHGTIKATVLAQHSQRKSPSEEGAVHVYVDFYHSESDLHKYLLAGKSTVLNAMYKLTVYLKHQSSRSFFYRPENNFSGLANLPLICCPNLFQTRSYY